MIYDSEICRWSMDGRLHGRGIVIRGWNVDGTLTGYGRGENWLETYTRFQVAFSQLFCYVSITLIMETENYPWNRSFYIKATTQRYDIFIIKRQKPLQILDFIYNFRLPLLYIIAAKTAILFLYMEFYFKMQFSLIFLIQILKASISAIFMVWRSLFRHFESHLIFLFSYFYRTYILFKFHNGKIFSTQFSFIIMTHK